MALFDGSGSFGLGLGGFDISDSLGLTADFGTINFDPITAPSMTPIAGMDANMNGTNALAGQIENAEFTNDGLKLAGGQTVGENNALAYGNIAGKNNVLVNQQGNQYGQNINTKNMTDFEKIQMQYMKNQMKGDSWGDVGMGLAKQLPALFLQYKAIQSAEEQRKIDNKRKDRAEKRKETALRKKEHRTSMANKGLTGNRNYKSSTPKYTEYKTTSSGSNLA